VDEESELL
jgi:hypothetical protein